MKNVGLNKLYSVNLKIFSHEAATVRASGADNILDNAIVVNDLDAALKYCGLVVGASARHLMHRLQRLFNRTRIEKTEMNILREILTAIHKFKNRRHK